MQKDRRYEAATVMWQHGKITVFSDLFKWMPKTTVAKDMHVDIRRLNACIADPSLLTSKEIDSLSDLYMVGRSVIKDLIREQVKAAPPVPRPGRR